MTGRGIGRAGVAAAVAALAVGATQVVAASDAADPPVGGPHPPPEAAADFAVLRRPVRAGDRPSRAMEVLARAEGADPLRSRRPALPPGSPDVGVLPARDDVCLLVEIAGDAGGAGYGCVPWEHARRGALYVTLSGGAAQAEGEALVAGLVPDRVEGVRVRRPTGATQELALAEGFYVTGGPAPSAIVVSGPDGEREIALGGLPQRQE